MAGSRRRRRPISCARRRQRRRRGAGSGRLARGSGCGWRGSHPQGRVADPWRWRAAQFAKRCTSTALPQSSSRPPEWLPLACLAAGQCPEQQHSRCQRPARPARGAPHGSRTKSRSARSWKWGGGCLEAALNDHFPWRSRPVAAATCGSGHRGTSTSAPCTRHGCRPARTQWLLGVTVACCRSAVQGRSVSNH